MSNFIQGLSSALPPHLISFMWTVKKGESRENMFGIVEAAKKKRPVNPGSVFSKLGNINALGRVGGFILKAILVLFFIAFTLGIGFAFIGMPPDRVMVYACLFLTLFTLMFGFVSVLGSLFYVKDISFYLALPVPGQTIVWGKLLLYIFEAVLGDLLMFPMIIPSMIEHGATPFGYLVALVFFILFAAALDIFLVGCMILIVKHTNFGANKDRLMTIFGVMVPLIAVASGLGMNYFTHVMSDDIESVMAVYSTLTQVLDFSYPIMCVLSWPAIFTSFVLSSDPLQVLFGLLGSVAALALLSYLFTRFITPLYLASVMKMQGSGSRRVKTNYSKEELKTRTSARAAYISHAIRDVITMFRTPVYMSQCIISTAIMSLYFIGIFAIAFIGGGRDILSELSSALLRTQLGDDLAFFFLVGFVGMGVFSGMSAYGVSSGVSRDGSDFFYLKAMPIRWIDYLIGKFVPLYLLSLLPPTIAIFILGLVLHMDPLLLIVGLVLMVMVQTSGNLISFSFGCFFPKLNWSNEQEAIKGAGGRDFLRVYGMMLISLAAALPLIIVIFLVLVGELFVGFTAVVLLIAAAILELGISLYIVFGMCPKRLESIEPKDE